jgi:hypothetical protein
MPPADIRPSGSKVLWNQSRHDETISSFFSESHSGSSSSRMVIARWSFVVVVIVSLSSILFSFLFSILHNRVAFYYTRLKCFCSRSPNVKPLCQCRNGSFLLGTFSRVSRERSLVDGRICQAQKKNCVGSRRAGLILVIRPASARNLRAPDSPLTTTMIDDPIDPDDVVLVDDGVRVLLQDDCFQCDS